LTVLKKNYTRLCHCLPKDYKKTVNKIREILTLPDDALNDFTNLPTVDLINEAIIRTLIEGIQADLGSLQFCDIMEALIDSDHSKTAIRTLRNGNLHIKIRYIPEQVWYPCYYCMRSRQSQGEMLITRVNGINLFISEC